MNIPAFYAALEDPYQDRANGGRDAKEPWKIYAARLIESLDSFRRENAGNVQRPAGDVCRPVSDMILEKY